VGLIVYCHPPEALARIEATSNVGPFSVDGDCPRAIAPAKDSDASSAAILRIIKSFIGCKSISSATECPRFPIIIEKPRYRKLAARCPAKGRFWDKRPSQIRPAFRRPVLLSRNPITGSECIGAFGPEDLH